MKKALTILLAILLIFVAGCTAQEEQQSPPTEIGNGKAQEISVDASDTADAESLEADAEPLFFSSVDEMTEAVRTERQAKVKDIMAQINELESLSVIYAPKNEITGYELQFIEVKPNRVFYRYSPTVSEQVESALGNEIIITLYRNEGATFDALCSQHGIIPDEDGFAYRKERGKMYFEQDGMAICVEVPEHLNDYDTIRSLCQMERIEISDDNEAAEDAPAIATWEIGAEEKMPQFSSVETLVQSSYFESLTTVYTPPAEMEGFCLRNIELLPHGMIYYYDPGEVPLDHFSCSQGITYTIHQNSTITMESICAQNELLPDEDGYAYDAEGCEMYFEQDGIAASVHVPEHMNDYDTLRSLCKLEKVTVP